MNYLIPADVRRKKLFLLLLVSLGFGASMSVLRVLVSGSPFYLFLIWNIFLAGIPLLISTVVAARRNMPAIALLCWLSVWLIFFPNAPYIITDLFHLRERQGIPEWYDLLLLVTYAWNGLFMGFISLMDMQQVVSRRAGEFSGWLFAGFSLVLASFGVYIGRFLRWNSWDILTAPGELLGDITDRLLYPADHPRTYALTFVFSIFLIIVYLMLRYMHPYDETDNRTAIRQHTHDS